VAGLLEITSKRRVICATSVCRAEKLTGPLCQYISVEKGNRKEGKREKIYSHSVKDAVVAV